MSTRALPPTHTHTTQRLTHLQAHTILTSFLHLTETNSAYRPDAHLTERGPVSSSAGAPAPPPSDDAAAAATAGTASGFGGNLTLNNLRRVLLGLEGRRIGGAGFTPADAAEEGDELAAGSKGSDSNTNGTTNDTGLTLLPSDTTQDPKSRPTKKRRTRREIEIDAEGEVIIDELPPPPPPPAAKPSRHTKSRQQTGADAPDPAEGEWQQKESYDLAQSDLVAAENEADADADADANAENDDETQPTTGKKHTESSGKVLGKKEERRVKRVEVPQRAPVAAPAAAASEEQGKVTMDKQERKRLKRLRMQEENKMRAEARRRA